GVGRAEEREDPRLLLAVGVLHLHGRAVARQRHQHHVLTPLALRQLPQRRPHVLRRRRVGGVLPAARVGQDAHLGEAALPHNRRQGLGVVPGVLQVRQEVALVLVDADEQGVLLAALGRRAGRGGHHQQDDGGGGGRGREGRQPDSGHGGLRGVGRTVPAPWRAL